MKTEALALGQLHTRVQQTLRGRVHYFRVELHDSGLVLHGRAPSFFAKQLAQHAVMNETAAPILRNDIEVSY
jgi:hypothetical protein